VTTVVTPTGNCSRHTRSPRGPGFHLACLTLISAPFWLVTPGTHANDESVRQVDNTAERRQSPYSGDRICGPRAVTYVLRHHGIRAPDLISVVKELQPMDLEQGTTLADLATALTRHGIVTRAVQIPPNAELRWPSPVLVHFPAAEPGANGHFAVWLPSSNTHRTDVYVGLAGVRSGPTRQFNEKLTNVVLLTSTSPIPESSRPFVVPRSFWAGLPATLSLGLAASAAVLWCIGRHWHWRRVNSTHAPK
jgi:Peptidase C39 family